MKILFIGKKSSSAGGPSTVMTMLKNHLEKNFNDEVEIINSDTLSLKKNGVPKVDASLTK